MINKTIFSFLSVKFCRAFLVATVPSFPRFPVFPTLFTFNKDFIMTENTENKFYRGVAEIDLAAIKQNTLSLISRLPEGKEAVAVIKADAYGHGAREVCRTLSDTVSAFAVATPEEAREILDLSNGRDIYILGYVRHEEFSFCAGKNVIPAIFSYEDALACSEAAVNAGKNIKINIKVDTGMGRIGFSDDEKSADTVAKIATLPNIEIYGLFTHYATSDCADKSEAYVQTKRFSSFISLCASRGVTFKKIHSANSAAALDMPSAPGNQCRLGIAIYGHMPSDEISAKIDLKPAMTFKSHVVFVKKIEKDDAVGYGRTYIADTEREIATVPIGYADGYPRALSGIGKVLVNGFVAPVVGRICMDMFMIDVTGMNVSSGDEVILIGSDGKNAVSAEEIAEMTGTISYEILCGVGKRIPRKYI